MNFGKTFMDNRGQPVQEQMYGFPYHHLVDFNVRSGHGFRLAREMQGGMRYASCVMAVVKELDHERPGAVVDIGCGDGFVTKTLSRCFPNADVAGIDVSDHSVRWARVFNGDRGAKIVQGDIRTYTFGKQFTAGVLLEVLEHIPPEAVGEFTKAVARLIEPNGKLIVTVPSTNLDVSRIRRHYQHFTIESLVGSMPKEFSLLNAEYVNKKGKRAKLVENTLCNSLFILNHGWIRDRLFRYYLRRLYHADWRTGLRIFAVFRKQ
jgi:2-polyprenyl-3-methyl-5-hydroxy-6-metoxy-1,4-benzoquinol methylase